MKAVLIATGYHPQLEPLVHYRPSPLLNISDKPILFHILEALIKQGIQQFDLVLCHLPEQIEARLEDGKRWGVEIQYHICKDNRHALSAIVAAAGDAGGVIVIGQADALPELPDLKGLDLSAPVFFNLQDQWSGWGVFEAQFLRNLHPNTSLESLPELAPNSLQIQVKEHLSTRELCKLLESNQKVLSQTVTETIFPTSSRKVEPGIWISKAVILEPGVTIAPPVFIGENTHIKSGAKIGPLTIIESHSLIDSDSTLENSLVCQNSYIGEGLEINHCIVDRNSLINLSHGTRLYIREEFLLGGSSPPSMHHLILPFFERGAAFVLFICFSPIYFWMRSRCPLLLEEKIQLPAPLIESEWDTFIQKTFIEEHSRIGCLFRRLPALFNIMKGEMHFFGVPPRSYEAVKALPEDWKKLYLQSKPGLITLEDVDYGSHATQDERYAAEVYYAVHMGWMFDLKLFARWITKKIKRI